MKLAIACVLLASSVASADKAVDALVAKLEPLRKLADREAKFCADSAKILDAANAIPDKAPSNVPLDKTAWTRVSGGVANGADSINDLCKTKTHSQKSVDGTTVTVATKIDEIYTSLDVLVDAAKPRTLSPKLAAVRKAIDGLSWQSAKFCANAKAIVVDLAKVEKPAGAPPTWDAFFGKLQQTAFGVETTACAKGKKAPEQVGGLQPELAEAFYTVVLLVPTK